MGGLGKYGLASLNLFFNNIEVSMKIHARFKHCLAAIRISLSYLNSRKRILLSMCPLCNSDAPKLYDCPMCDGRHAARGDKWPPPQSIKDGWLRRLNEINGAQRDLLSGVLKSRLSR